MTFFFWALPTLVVAGAIASGRLGVTSSALLGLLVAVPVAVATGPATLGIDRLGLALARGLWIGATIAPYILGGVLFWRIAADAGRPGGPSAGSETRRAADSPLGQRRLLFFACFLVGPFAESATGFGVGILGTVALLRPLGMAPRHLIVFGLLSQTMIPWGAMGSGTLLAAAYARLPADLLALHSLPPVSLLMGLWLVLFWRVARASGFGAPAAEHLREAVWTIVALATVGLATAYLGPESALLAAYAPLIVIRYLLDWRPDPGLVRSTATRVMPFGLLIGWLVVTRLQPTVREALGHWRLAPFGDLPVLMPLLHAGTWLMLGAVVTASVRGAGGRLGREGAAAWATGRQAVLGLLLFAMMAEVLSVAGISRAVADGMYAGLAEGALLATPVLSAVFGILSNSGNAPNSLFMPSQVAVAAQAGLGIPAVAAIQHVAGTSMSLVSPVRLSIAAAVAGGTGQERAVYLMLLPFAAAGMAILLLAMAATILAQ